MGKRFVAPAMARGHVATTGVSLDRRAHTSSIS
jgi:hypothetical protein